MVDVVRTVIRLGNFSDGIADIDPNGTGAAEGAAALVGDTYTSSTMSVETITYSDGDNDGDVEFDSSVGPGGDYITYDLGSGPVSETVDQGVWYDVDILLADSSTLSTSAMIFQTPSGETFLTEFATSLDNLDIQSITPTQVNNNLFSRMFTSNSVDNTTVCFGLGSEILTPDGPRPVETLRPGDLVTTADGLTQAVKAVLRVSVDADGSDAAFRIEKDAFGPGMPETPLYLTGNHRVLCASRLVARMFDVPQVLIPLKRFAHLDGVSPDIRGGSRRFFHLELEDHAVLLANGALVESCLLGPMSLGSLPDIYATMASIREVPQPRYPVPLGRMQRQFVRRLIKRGHPVVEDGFLPVGQSCSSVRLSTRLLDSGTFSRPSLKKIAIVQGKGI